MNAWTRLTATAAAGCVGALIAGSAIAAEITVAITGGPLPETMSVLAPLFEKASGHKVKVSMKAGPAIVKELKEGGNIDLIVSASAVIDELVKDGMVAP